ncbi:hypothetical protein EDC04DRAFT_2615393 [Pisolithus marmoratus]|nr:hypothetical protein EDC04DRAFT_2615393 [Pisolithus marmoratus]
MSDCTEVYSEILSSYAGKYKDARGNSELRNELLAEAIRRVFLPGLDPEDQDDEIAVMQHILAVSGKRVEDPGEGEDAREEQARPTKAGDYKKAFVASTAAQKLFKDKMDAYDRERWDTKDPKTIGKRTKIVQEWWESLSDDKKAEAGRWQESGTSWVHLRQPMTHKYWRKNLPSMARDFIGTVHRTMGTHVMMFVAHEAGEGQVKMAVFETAPGDGKKAFTESSEPSKDWVLNGENIFMDYLLASPVEEHSAEKQELEISLDEDGNPEVPTWAMQKLKVQQNFARSVFQAAYVWDIAKFTKKPKAKVPWGLPIKSPMEYLGSESIPEGFTMKDPSKWTKADLGLLWDHWQSQEAEEKVIVSFIDCKKEDAPLPRQFDRQVPSSSKKKPWVDVEDDSEAEAGGGGVAGPSDQNMDLGEVQKRGLCDVDVRDQTPEESSPAWHASKDQTQYLKSLSIMPRYQVLVDLVDGLPEVDVGTKVVLPHWATWAWSAKYLPEEMHLDAKCFWGALGQLQSSRFGCSSKGFEVVLGLGLLLRECSCAQEVEEDDPAVGHLHFLLNSVLCVQRGEDVMDIVGLVISRLEQRSMQESKEGDGSAGVGGSDGRDEEKEEEEAVDATLQQKRKRAGSGMETRRQKMLKEGVREGGVEGKRGVRTWNQARRAK